MKTSLKKKNFPLFVFTNTVTPILGMAGGLYFEKGVYAVAAVCVLGAMVINVIFGFAYTVSDE